MSTPILPPPDPDETATLMARWATVERIMIEIRHHQLNADQSRALNTLLLHLATHAERPPDEVLWRMGVERFYELLSQFPERNAAAVPQ